MMRLFNYAEGEKITKQNVEDAIRDMRRRYVKTLLNHPLDFRLLAANSLKNPLDAAQIHENQMERVFFYQPLLEYQTPQADN